MVTPKATRRGFFAVLFAMIAARFAPKPKKLPMSRADFEATLMVYEELFYRKLDEQTWLHLEASSIQVGTGYIRLLHADPGDNARREWERTRRMRFNPGRLPA